MPDEITPETRAHLDAADEHRRQKEESFQRSDTDGALTQWSRGLSASEARIAASISHNGGRAEFCGLYDGDRRVAARAVEGKWDWAWLLRDDEAERYGRRFVPMGERSRIQKALGLAERREMAPARAAIVGTGKGLSGQAWAAAVRVGDEWGQDASPGEEVEIPSER